MHAHTRRLIMNYFIYRCTIFIILSLIPHLQLAYLKRFTIVSDSIVVQNIYPRIQDTKPLHNELNIDFNTKNQICKDITRSYFFHKLGIKPCAKPDNTLATRFFGRPKWMYPVQTIKVWIPLQKITLDESVFVCLAQKENRRYKYYISEEYELDANDHIPGWFVFISVIGEGKSLFGLAESTAEILFHPDYMVEETYLQRRAKYRIAWKVQFDSLCGLSDEDKERVCLAIFWSSNYFAVKIPASNASEIKGICNLRTVSFQTEHGAIEAAKRKFREWMLTCQIKNEGRTVLEDLYTLSQTYHSNEMILYKRDVVSRDIFPEILLTNIRLVFDSKNHRPAAADEAVAEDYAA